MRLATAILVSVALVCSARADDAYRYRQIRFGSALTHSRLSSCSIQFEIAFDPRPPSRREDVVEGEIIFSRRYGRLSAAMVMRAFGDYTTKFTGVGQISDVTLTTDERAFSLKTQNSQADPAQQALPPEQVADLLTAVEGGATLGFTLSDPARHFVFPFSLMEEGLSTTSGDLASAGRSTFDDCMMALARSRG